MVNTTPYPDAPGESGSVANIAKLLGVGAYTIDDSSQGSGLNFGQDVGTETFVKSLIYSVAMGMGTGDGTITSALNNLGTYLQTMSLDSLKLLQPYVPNTTPDDFSTVETAVEKTLAMFQMGSGALNVDDFNNWVETLLDPFAEIWDQVQKGWDQLLDIFQNNVTVPINAGVQAIKDWWTSFQTNNPLWNQLVTWWNQILATLGISTGTGAGTAVGSQIYTAGATASSAQTQATTQLGWWQRLPENLLILLLDGFHIFYPLGSPSDTPTTTVGGKRTWYAANADMKALFATISGTSAPSITAQDVGTKVTTNTTDIQGTKDAVVQAIVPSAPTGATAAAVAGTLSTVQQNVSSLQDQVTGIQATQNSPTTVLSDNGQSSPGSGIGAGWTTTGVTAINRDATYGFNWATSGNSPRLEKAIFGTPLATSDQVCAITLNKMMVYWPADFYGGTFYQDGAPENWLILRADTPTNPQNFVFARIRYADVQFGYSIGGTVTMVGSPTTFYASASAGYTFYAGDASSDYNYKLVSNGRTILSWNDTGHLTSSLLPNLYPGQAWKSDTDPGRSVEAYPASTSWRAWDASASAGTPKGYGHATRTSGSSQTMTSGQLPYDFFDTAVVLGDGISLPASGQFGFIVRDAGLYAYSWGIRQPSTSNATDIWPGIAVNGTPIEISSTVMYDGGGTLLQGANYGMASAGVLLNAGDRVSPWMGAQSGVGGTTSFGLSGIGGSFNGDPTGARSYQKIAKIG